MDENVAYSGIYVVNIEDTGFAVPYDLTDEFLEIISIEQNSSVGTTVYTVKGVVEGEDEGSTVMSTLFATLTGSVLSYYYIYQ